MKYIKLFELYSITNYSHNDLHKYRVGDYVVIDINRSYYTEKLPIDISMGKITIEDTESFSFPYVIQFSDSPSAWIPEESIIRKMTDEEINEYELKINVKKYNI